MGVIMRIERIEGNRSIRVLLTQNDLSEMNVNIRTLTSDSPELHSFLFKVMDFIREETGFNASSGQIVVEASPQGDGVILTVTKISPDKKPTKVNPKNIRVKAKKTKKHIYRFEDFEALWAYLTIASSDSLSGMKLFECDSTYFAVTDRLECAITEFAAVLPPIGTSNVFLSEHGRLVAEGDGLLTMAEELKK